MAGSLVGDGVAAIFHDLSYGTTLDGEAVARAWLEKNTKKFGFFIDNQWFVPNEERKTFQSKKPATGEVLAENLEATQADIDAAVKSSEDAFKTWSKLSGHVRARYLYSVARNLQKHQSLLAVLEAMNCGKPTRETRGVDVPAVIRQVYHNAGWAQLMDEEMKGWKPRGVTVIIPHWSFPLMQLASRAAAALAMGNTVVVMPPSLTSLSSLLFAEVCAQAGLPAGVLNVVTGMSPNLLITQPSVAKVTFVGSIEDGQSIRTQTSGQCKDVSLELSGRCPVLVLEEADVDSAVEGIIEAALFNSGQSNHAGSRLLIQEPIFGMMIKKLKARMSKLAVGDNMDKNKDQGPLVCSDLVQRLMRLVATAEAEGAEVFKSSSVPANNAYYFPPTLVTNVQAASQIYLEEICGPLIVAVPFRTVKEGITLANHSVFGTAASIWTENISVALEAAKLLRAGTVWINSHNTLDAAAGVGGCKASGYGRIGGKEGLYEYVQPSWQTRQPIQNFDATQLKQFGGGCNADLLPGAQAGNGENPEVPSIDKTFKLFYGGGQKRPDSGASRPITSSDGTVLGYAPDGSRKDIRNAVEAAFKAAPGWGKKEGHGRAQIMYYMAENLQCRRAEFVSQLITMTGQTEAAASLEVDKAVERLFYWAAYCDKYGGSVQETTLYGLTVKCHESVGVVVVVCPDNFPFLGFISLIAPAIARGNAVVVVPSEKYPLAALGFHQVLETSDLPAGVVNIITGSADVLTKTAAEHHDVDTIWYFGSALGSKFVEMASAGNLKRTWLNFGAERDFLSTEQGQGEEFLFQATSCKNIWLPMGDIFAN